MHKVLRKRILREFKNNFLRYVALIFLIGLGMYVVVSLVGAAQTIITGTERKAEENMVEDGQFQVFIPLNKSQEKELSDTGIILERVFSMDVKLESGSVLRIMKNRKNINLTNLDEGRFAKENGEIVLEKRFSEINGISLSDTIQVSGVIFKVVGIGSTPDYDMPLKKISDVSAQSSLFGTAFVVDEQYESILSETKQMAEEYCYSYRLNGTLTDEELKNKIKEYEFDYQDIEDVFFKEMVEDSVGKKDEVKEGIRSLDEGATELQGGAGDLDNGAEELNDGAGDLADGAGKLSSGAGKLNDGISEVSNALTELDSNSGLLKENSKKIKEALSEIQSGLNESGELSGDDLKKLSEASTKIREGTNGLHNGLVQLDGSIDTYYAALQSAGITDSSALISMNGNVVSMLGLTDTMRILYEASQAGNFDTELSNLSSNNDPEAVALSNKIIDDANAASEYLTTAGKMIAVEKMINADIAYIQGSSQLIDGISAVLDSQNGELMTGAASLADNYSLFDDNIQKLVNSLGDLSGGMKQLREGIDTLSAGYAEFDNGIGEYTDAVSKILDGYGELTDGSQQLYKNTKKLYNGSETLHDGTQELKDSTGELHEGTKELSKGVRDLRTESDELMDTYFKVDMDNLISFIKACDNPRIDGAAGDTLMNKQIGMMAGVIVMALFTYVLSVFVIHQIQQESSVIGALYALGVKRKDLLVHYITLPAVICFIGGVIGTLIAFSKMGIENQMKDTYQYFSIPKLQPIYPGYLIAYSLIMPTFIAVVVNYLVIRKRLARTALSLLRNEQKEVYKNIKVKNLNFLHSFQVRQMVREIRTGFTVVIGMTIALMIFMIALNCYVLCVNVEEDTKSDTRYEYMYSLKYPEKEIPKDAEACYSESLSKTNYGFTLDITVLGVDDNNPYFDVQVKKGKNKIVISESVQQKYNLKIGDKVILADSANGLDYAFTIEDICDYSASLMVFMDIDSMRELFGQEDGYYNVLFTDKLLDIEEGRLYSVTSKPDMWRASEVFTKLMMPLVLTLTFVSIIMFSVVMYLMLNVMIERAGTGISLIKIFGYRTNEIRKLYLNGNTYIVALGAMIGIPLSKKLLDMLYPWLIANAACGMNLQYPWYYYVGIFVGIMSVYYGISYLLVRKIRNISPTVVLKNRE